MKIQLICITIFISAMIIACFTQIDWKTAAEKAPLQEKVDLQYIDGKLQTATILTKEQLLLQQSQGCTTSACHNNF